MSPEIPFVHSTRLWDQSIAPTGPLMAFSELPRGHCPVVTGTFTINYVIEGVERYVIGGRETRVMPGELLLVEPGTAATAYLEGSDTVRGISIYLPSPDGPVSAFDEEHSRGFLFRADRSPLGSLLVSLRNRLAAGESLSCAERAAVMAAATEAFNSTVSGLAADAMRVNAVKPATRRRILRQVYLARDYLLSHPARAVPLAELAAIVGMSQFHLARSFAAIHGCPPARFHAAARVAAAADEIAAGRLSVADAAAQFGFADRSSFAKAFRRERGQYPAVRQRNSQGET